MIRLILFGKWSGQGFSLHEQWFYRIKGLICWFLPDPKFTFNDYGVVITYFGGGKAWSEYGTNYWYECITVGYGLFRNWWCIYDTGSSD